MTSAGDDLPACELAVPIQHFASRANVRCDSIDAAAGHQHHVQIAIGGCPRLLRTAAVMRARVARRTCLCAIVPHAPNNRPAPLQLAFRAAAARVALQSGCTFEAVLSGIWADGSDSMVERLTVDGMHPISAGYERKAGRLARLIVRYRRCAVRSVCASREFAATGGRLPPRAAAVCAAAALSETQLMAERSLDLSWNRAQRRRRFLVNQRAEVP